MTLYEKYSQYYHAYYQQRQGLPWVEALTFEIWVEREFNKAVQEEVTKKLKEKEALEK